MAALPPEASGDSDTAAGESGGGSLFKSFWSKSKLKKPLRFIQYGTGTGDGEGAKQTPSDNSSRRRKQTYEAKQRHEARKADYVKSLEQEINKLREDTIAARAVARRLASETRALRNVATAHGIDVMGAPGAGTPIYIPSFDDYMNVEIGFDDVLQVKRSFVKPRKPGFVQQQASLPSFSDLAVPQIVQAQPREDTIVYATLDFILALEHICQTHIHYPWDAPAGVPEDGNGHLFTTTASLYSWCRPQPRISNQAPAAVVESDASHSHDTDMDWLISYADIQRLMQLSDELPVPEGDITPAQAVRLIETRVSKERLVEVLQTLKGTLGPDMRCWGFGASMAIEKLDAALLSLGTN